MTAVKIEDLNPIEAIINLNNKDYTLRKFDLLARTWAYNEFSSNDNKDGLMVLSEKIKEVESGNFEPLLKVCWHLHFLLYLSHQEYNCLFRGFEACLLLLMESGFAYCLSCCS